MSYCIVDEELDELEIYFSSLQCTAGSVCKKTCAGEELDCYILDDNGFIIISEDVSQTGRFFGQVDGTIMDSLVQDKIYKKVTVNDHQGRCPDARNPFSGEACKLSVSATCMDVKTAQLQRSEEELSLVVPPFC